MTGSIEKPGSLLLLGLLLVQEPTLLGAVRDGTWEERLQVQRSEVEKRIALLDPLGIHIHEYSQGLSDDALRTRFEAIAGDRWLLYLTNPEDYSKPGGFGVFKPDFQTPAQWRNWHSRYPYPMAFQGTGIPDLHELLSKVRGSAGAGAIAVSCRIGAGRTGTFIASYEILDAIARQRARGLPAAEITLNVDRIFWEVTVQRPFAITHFTQYQTLYRFADFCLSQP